MYAFMGMCGTDELGPDIRRVLSSAKKIEIMLSLVWHYVCLLPDF